MIDNSLKHMIIFKNHNTTDQPSMTTQFLFYQNGHNGQLGLKHGKNAGEENRRRTRVKCDENDDDTVVIDTNAEDCPGEL